MSNSLFEVTDLSQSFWNEVLTTAHSIKKKTFSVPSEINEKKVGLLFFEPSSRTRWSFEKACLDLGIPSMTSVVDQTTSLSKGEEHKDSLELYLQLGFDLVVMRSGGDLELKNTALSAKVKFINAGFGAFSHPTQALLDYFTWTYDFDRKVEKVLIMGDLKHSRVLRSHLRFSKIMGYKVGLYAAKNLEVSDGELKEFSDSVEVFSDRKAAINWADAVMPLRVQKERHQSQMDFSFSPLLCSELREDQAVLHPGPFMRGEDLEDALLKDKRSLIFKQKQNGVYCRSALLSCMLSE